MTSPTRAPQIVAEPGEAEYLTATASFNLRSAISPVVASVARTTSEVQELVSLARERSLKVRVQSTGHGFNSIRPMSDALLIRTQLNTPVRVDPKEKTASVPAGTYCVIVAGTRDGARVPAGGYQLSVQLQ